MTASVQDFYQNSLLAMNSYAILDGKRGQIYFK